MDSASRRARTRERWLRRAQRINDAFGLVLFLVLLTYVLASLLSNRGWPAVVLIVATSATSVISLTSSQARESLVRTAVSLSALAIALAAISAVSGDRTWLNVASVIQIGLLTVATGAVLHRVVTSAEVGFRTILGAISVYTVLGLLFSFAYGTIARIQETPFFQGVPHPHGSDFLFFSYTTLTTTGYGDLVPAGQPGQMVSGLEMMLGQIFLVTLVAGLVSLWRPGDALRHRRQKSGSEGAAPEAPPVG
jgi:Ion channel